MDSDAVKNSLNLTGNFLNIATAKFLKDELKCERVTVEEPYAYSASGKWVEGTADILALKYLQDMFDPCWLALSVECKKANPDHKLWLFQKDIFYEQDVSSNPYYSNPLLIRSGKLIASNLRCFHDRHLCNYGFEFNDRNGSLNKNQDNKIFSAAKQANDALNGLVDKDAHKILSAFKLNQRAIENVPILAIPIVVTTAQLGIMKYETDNVDLEKGEIAKDKLEIEPVDWVNYSFPLVPSMQLVCDSMVNGTLTENSVMPNRRMTFIVNATKINDFITWFNTDVTYLLG